MQGRKSEKKNYSTTVNAGRYSGSLSAAARPSSAVPVVFKEI